MTENINDGTTWLSYLYEVARAAKCLGYEAYQVAQFQKDIQRCWLEHVSVDKCVEGLFSD